MEVSTRCNRAPELLINERQWEKPLFIDNRCGHGLQNRAIKPLIYPRHLANERQWDLNIRVKNALFYLSMEVGT